jgi:hypothetical protein
MKQNSTLVGKCVFIIILFLLVIAKQGISQITLVLGNPTTSIYGLTSNGVIYEINTNNAQITKTIKNNTYSGNSPSSSNGLAYNTVNGKFYYFKRNFSSGSQEFVSFSPTLGVLTILTTASTITDDIHTGAITHDGKYYYTVDIQGVLHVYNIATNTWTKISSTIKDQSGTDVAAIIRTQNAGDIAVDGNGNLWMLTSSTTNYGLYKLAFPLPTTATATVTVTRVISPTAVTPTGNSFAGIAFNANGQIFLGTRGDDKLYLLQNNNSLTFIGNFNQSDAGNDLTSLNFPASVLPVKWVNFSASVENSSTVKLNWDVIEYQNKGFNVQHSADGSKWENVTFINSRKIQEVVQGYDYSYATPLSGKQYYRIEQVDIDGKLSYSDVKTVNLSSSSRELSMWPNPAKNVININNDGSNSGKYSTAQIYNLSGNLSLEKKLTEGLNTIDISNLPAGAYIVKAFNNAGNFYTQKIIKQ